MTDRHKTKAQLMKELADLRRQMADKQNLEEEFLRQTHNLGERIKELDCLYKLDEITRKEGISIQEVIKRTGRLIPPAWQYPEITGCCIMYKKKKHKTKNFKKTKWMQKADIVVNNQKAGSVEVCYMERKPERDEGPFLKEERYLINTISEGLGRFIEHKQIDEKVRGSEERLRILFEYAPDAYYLNDLKGNLVDGNLAAEKLMGYKREELIGKSFLKLKILPSEQVPKAASLLAKNMLGKATGPDEFDLIRKDGSSVLAEIRTYPVKIKGRTLVLGIARDITERKRIEEGIKWRIELEKTLSNISSRFVGLFDMDEAINASLSDIGRLCEASRAYIFLFKDDGATMDNTHEWCVDGVSPQIDNLKNLPTSTFPWWMSILKKGEIIYIKDVSKLPPEAKAEKKILEAQDIKSLLVLPVSIKEKPVGFIGLDKVMSPSIWSDEDLTILRMASDIIGNALERKQAEEVLSESEEKYRTVIENIEEGYYEVDLTGNLTFFNDALCRMLGYSKGELLGMNNREYLDEESAKKVYKIFNEVYKTGVMNKTVELQIEGRKGDKKYGELSVSPMKNSRNQPIGFRGIVRDTTESRLIERAVRKRKEQLELIHQIQNEIPMNMDIETILQKTAESLGSMYGYNKISVNLVDKHTNEIMHLVGWNKSGTPTPKGHKQKMGEGIIGTVVKTKKAIIANDVSKEPSYVVYYQSKTKSEMSIPLLVEDRLVGVLDIQDTKKNAFKEEDISVLRSIANYLSYVINEKQTEETLRASLMEKDVLLREIHHRVKNNLQVISSLLNLQSPHIKGRKNLEMFKDSQNRVKSMALIHEKLYQSQDLARINFKDYITTLAKGLFNSYRTSIGNINLKIEAEDVLLGVDNAIPCGLIINELVSNSLKHAFSDREEGEIKIGLHSSNGKDIKLEVSDNGVGLPEDLDIRKTKSLGLRLVTILAEDQLHGEVKLDRKKGTKFQIIV